jgi:hypothetical protein
VRLDDSKVRVDGDAYMNESDLSDDRVIGLMVMFLCFWKSKLEALAAVPQCDNGQVSFPDGEFVVPLKTWFRKDCVPRHIDKAVLTARSSSHATFSEASQQMMVLPMLRVIDDRSDARLVTHSTRGRRNRLLTELLPSYRGHDTPWRC